MSNIRVIVDHIGRTVVGDEVSSTPETLTLNNPVIIHVQPNPQTNQLQVQSFPYLFMEFIKPSARDTNQWTFNKNNIVTSTAVLEDNIIAQYRASNSSAPQQPQADAEVIKLFED